MLRRFTTLLVTVALAACAGCAHHAQPTLGLVQTEATGAAFGQSGMVPTHESWVALIDRAQEQIDLSHFYASGPRGPGEGKRYDAIIEALGRAKKRGVRVRFLFDALFAQKYAKDIERLRRLGAVRLFDMKPHSGGVQHAKYMVIDSLHAYVGSANFDWRALEHIHELGVQLTSVELGRQLQSLFEFDWRLAAGETPPPIEAWSPTKIRHDGQWVTVHAVASPKPLVGQSGNWDLPHLLKAIDGAKHRVWLQLLSYKAQFRDGSAFDAIESALVRAAARGVSVQLLLSHWMVGPRSDVRLGRLLSTQGVRPFIVTLPEDASGYIPYARVIHAKYLLIDDQRSWIGTSNFSGDYFYKSRNVGLLIEGASVNKQLQDLFKAVRASRWTAVYDTTRHRVESPKR